jgi:hypothetical protein
VHIVNNAARTAITSGGNKGYDWGRNVWRRLRVVRDIQAGTIDVYGEGQAAPILRANNKIFGTGYIGFGSFDDTGRIRNVRIWAAERSMIAPGSLPRSSVCGARGWDPRRGDPDTPAADWLGSSPFSCRWENEPFPILPAACPSSRANS